MKEFRVRRYKKNAIRNLLLGLSYGPLIIAVVISLSLFVPFCFGRMPIYSYFCSEGEFPITYKLNGVVKKTDNGTGQSFDKIEVIVGGYSVSVLEEERFSLIFTSAKTEEVIVIIKCNKDNNLMYFVKPIRMSDGKSTVNEVFYLDE